MNKEEITFLREHLKEIYEYKGLQQELTYDMSIEILNRICKALDYLQQENEKLKEQYCERTDCSGRLGNSKKVEELIKENERLEEENLKLAEENIDLRTYIYAEKASFKSDGKNFYEIMEMPTYEELQEKNQKLKEKNIIYKSTIKGQYNKIKELQNSKRISKKVHKERKRKLQEENQKLKEEILKLEDKYIHNVPCCNEEDCDFYKKYTETSYLKGYEDGIEKYNHYKLLYQKVKERNTKVIDYIEKNCWLSAMKEFNCLESGEVKYLVEILKGNNEVSNEDN